MAWRKWLVRTLVFSIVGLAGAAVLLYQVWTRPSAVRHQVLARLGKECVGAAVSLESARLRLLGGIAVHDLRMSRRDDLERGDFLYVPSAVLYHDKEHLLDGAVAIRKIELERPHLRIVRQRDGRINLAGVLAPPDLAQRTPTLIVRGGTIVLEDRRDAGPAVLLEIKEVNLTIANDPLSTLVLDGSGQTDVAGTVRFQARVDRASNSVSAVVDVPEAPLSAALLHRLSGFCPEALRQFRQPRGKVCLQAALAYRPQDAEPFCYDVRAEVRDGHWHPDCLPAPLQHIHAKLRCVNGRIPHAELTARSEGARVQLNIYDLAWPGHQPAAPEEAAGRIDLRLEHFLVTPRTFEHLPRVCKQLRDLYQPAGPVTASYRFQRGDDGGWRKQWLVQPEGMVAQFKDFPYPIDNVRGSVRLDLSSAGGNRVRIDLTGRGGNRPVTVKGSFDGREHGEVDAVVSADEVPIDDKLLTALPKKSRDLARTFLPAGSRELGLADQPLRLVQPAGLVNIKVHVRRAPGQEHFANRYLIAFHDSAVQYDLFPYPLEKVTGLLDIQPDHWECRDFHGSHKGGAITVNAGSYRYLPSADNPPQAAGSADNGQPTAECVQVAISGKGVLLDGEFEQALAPPEVRGRAALRSAWAMLALRGRLNFESIVMDRPDRPQDIDVAVDVRGCSMQPDFFRYAMSDVSANVRYNQGFVSVKDVRARHGACRLAMDNARIVLHPAGGFTAWLKEIRGQELTIDEDFLRALHPALRRALEPLQVQKPLIVRTTSLTLDAPAVAGEPMKIWWEGGAYLRQQIFQAGVEIKDVDGVIWCNGHHNGRQFEYINGNAQLARAHILDQPFTKLQGRFAVDAETPDVMSLYDLSGQLFDGFVGGEGRFTFRSPIRYQVKLDALNVQLEQFGKHNRLGSDAELQGPAQASLFLIGEGSDLSGLRGDGRIEVAHGKMYRLPLLLGLLKAFGLRLPDQTAFEQARMLFAIRGPQMRVHALDLLGNAISLRGQGVVNLDGSDLHLDFSADWGRLPQLLPPGLSDLSQLLSDQLFKIKLRGKIASPRFEKEVLPPVVEPIKKVFGGT